MLAVPGLLAVIGFFVAGFAKGIVNIVLLAMGAIAGAAIVLAFFDLFNINTGLTDWLFALIGAVVGLILVRRFKDPALIVLAGLVGALLVTRGLTIWVPGNGGRTRHIGCHRAGRRQHGVPERHARQSHRRHTRGRR